MIRLIRCDGVEILLNVDQIESVVTKDRTIITLTGGEEVYVKNAERDIIGKMRAAQIGLLEAQESENEETAE